MLRWTVFLIVLGIFDIYAFQALKTAVRSHWILALYWIITLLVVGNFVYSYYAFNRSNGFSHSNAYAAGFLIAIVVPKIILLLFMFGEDIFRIPLAIYKYITEGDLAKGNYFPERRKFISQLALGIAAVPFASIIYGIYKGRYNYKVL